MTEKISVPVMALSNRSGEFKEEFADGIVGGFTFPDGHKSLIYQCGKCGVLCEYNTGYNKHQREAHNAKENVEFGFAEEQNWEELDITVEDIEVLGEKNEMTSEGKDYKIMLEEVETRLDKINQLTAQKDWRALVFAINELFLSVKVLQKMEKNKN